MGAVQLTIQGAAQGATRTELWSQYISGNEKK